MTFVTYLYSTYNIDPVHAHAICNLSRCLDGEFAEICVSDGGSTNESLHILESCSTVHVVRSSPDHGQYHAWNLALCSSKGKYIAFMGADDVPNARFAHELFTSLSKGLALPAVAYGPIARIRKNKLVIFNPRSPQAFLSRFTTMALYHPGILFRSDIFASLSYDLSCRYAADFDLLISIANNYHPSSWFYCRRVQALVGSAGMSSSTASLLPYLREYIYIAKKHHVFPLGSFLRVLLLLALKPSLGYVFKRILNYPDHSARGGKAA